MLEGKGAVAAVATANRSHCRAVVSPLQ